MDPTTDRSVQVWSVERQEPESEFKTVLDFGGQRLALCTTSDRMVVVAGAWERQGICGYDASTGNRLWQRKDLKQVQSVAPADDGSAVAACFDSRSMQVLEAVSGTTITTVRGVRGFWQSRHRAIAPAEVMGHVALLATDSWRVHWRAPVAGFGLLDAAFGPDALLVSNAIAFDSGEADSVYCFSLEGQLLWKRQTADGTNVPWLAWDEDTGGWLGIRHDIKQRTPETLLRWSQDGALLSRIPLGSRVATYAFLPAGRLMVTGLGQVVDTRTARQIGRLPPPATSEAELGS